MDGCDVTFSLASLELYCHDMDINRPVPWQSKCQYHFQVAFDSWRFLMVPFLYWTNLPSYPLKAYFKHLLTSHNKGLIGFNSNLNTVSIEFWNPAEM